MIKSIEEIRKLEKIVSIPFNEILAMDLNLSGIVADLPYKRVRFNLWINEDNSLLFSVENNKKSLYNIRQNKLFFGDIFLFNIDDLVEDSCEIFYTRKGGKVLCFNPNNRSLCHGCRFCYQPKSSDKRQILPEMLLDVFTEWMGNNEFNDLSYLEQVAVVTGCFNNEKMVVNYLFSLRDVLAKLNFRGEILYFGIISDVKNIELLSEIKPLQLCFTIECFDNRPYVLLKNKNLALSSLQELMKKSMELGIATTFSYILGLDSLVSMEKNILLFKDFVTAFPIISLFQTDNVRIQYRNFNANNLYYYIQSRKKIESIFATTNLVPNSWSNYRSLWRTCYGESNKNIL